jgi:Domain of unknown function (DUF5655)/Domain of unknown function (DUF4287)
MSTVEQAVETQITNIQKKTGKSLEELNKMIAASGLEKHGEIRSMLIEKLGLGYGDANSLVHYLRKSDGESAAREKGLTEFDVLDDIYKGPKASLRQIHTKIMDTLHTFGEFEIAPKKGYVSLRRKKQFAMVGPGSSSRVDLGINHKNLPQNPRLLAQPAGSMCQYIVRLTSPDEVDAELIAWLKNAYTNAG